MYFPPSSRSPPPARACSDFVAYPDRPGSDRGTQPSIVGFTDLYSNNAPSCGATIPTVAWSYNTTAADTALIDTSPVLSNDGKQIAFAEGTHLVLIKLPTSDNGNPQLFPMRFASSFSQRLQFVRDSWYDRMHDCDLNH